MNAVTDIRPEAAFDQKDFRNALGTFPTGVAIITTVGAAGEPVGLTCNSFSSVSLEPPLVSWSLRKASKSLETFRDAPSFTINILAGDQNELSGRFASSKVADKFAGVDWRPGHGGAPVIGNSLASFECSTFAVHDAGDHLIFIGQVQRFDHGRPEDPLVFYKGAYVMLTQSLRDLVAGGTDVAVNLNDARSRIYTMILRLACEHGTAEQFDAIEKHLDQLEAYVAPGDIEKRMQAGVQFFRLIGAAAHNDVLNVVADSLNTMLQHALKAQILEIRKTRPTSDLVNAEVVPLRRRLLEHMRARDADGAERTLAEFITHASLLKAAKEIAP
jgi:flavin reductase (DIM6/NTAB) family NADH-FMN oxidoreductase RutF